MIVYLLFYFIFSWPEKLIRCSGEMVVVIDWEKFYAIGEEEMDFAIQGHRLLTNKEAVLTGLLTCKYLHFPTANPFDSFFNFISLTFVFSIT